MDSSLTRRHASDNEEENSEFPTQYLENSIRSYFNDSDDVHPADDHEEPQITKVAYFLSDGSREDFQGADLRTAAIKLSNNVFGSQGDDTSADTCAETSSGDHSQEEDFSGYFQGDSDDDEEPDEDDDTSYDYYADQYNWGENDEDPTEPTVNLQAENDFVCSAIAADSDGPYDRDAGPWWIFEDEDGKFIAKAYEDDEADDPCWAWLAYNSLLTDAGCQDPSLGVEGWTWKKFAYCDAESGVEINIEKSYPDSSPVYNNVNPHESDLWEYVDDGHIELMIVASDTHVLCDQAYDYQQHNSDVSNRFYRFSDHVISASEAASPWIFPDDVYDSE